MTTVKKETPKEEVKKTEAVKETPKATETVKVSQEEVKAAPTPEKVTDSGITKIEVGGGEQVLNGGRDALEGDPSKGIDKKADGAKDQLDTQKKAEDSIKDGSAGLNAIQTSEVMNGLGKDFLSDRPVYPTNSAYMAAMSASGKLAGE